MRVCRGAQLRPEILSEIPRVSVTVHTGAPSIPVYSKSTFFVNTRDGKEASVALTFRRAHLRKLRAAFESEPASRVHWIQMMLPEKIALSL